MSKKYTLTEEEINGSILNSPYSLPDSPSEVGLRAGQIKKYFYQFIRYLANSINNHLKSIGEDMELREEEISSLIERDEELGTLFSNSITTHNLDKSAHFYIVEELYKRLSDHDLSSDAHKSLRELIEQARQRAEGAYNLASGKSKVYPCGDTVDMYKRVRDLNSELNVGDVLILGQKNVPEFMVYSKNEEAMEGVATITLSQLESNEITLEAGGIYYIEEAKICLLGMEGGIDVSTLTLKSEFDVLANGFNGFLSYADSEINQLKEELSKREILKTIVNTLDENVTLENNCEYRLGTRTSISLSLPENIDEDYEAILTFYSPSKETSFDAPDSIIFTQDDSIDGRLYPVSNRIYEINIKNVCGSLIGRVGAIDYEVVEA